MREINVREPKMGLGELLNKEIQASVRLGDLVIAYALIAQSSTNDVKNAISKTSGLKSELSEYLGEGNQLDEFKLYKEIQAILSRYRLY